MRHASMCSAISRPFAIVLFGLLSVSLLVSGCASSTKIAKSAKGSVQLEEVTDWSFEASHPAVIDHATLMKALKGMYADEGMSAGGSKPMRMFSDEDAEFLTPLLAQGLSKARPEQLVGFRMSSSAGSGSEPTTGSIYVQRGEIHIAIAKAQPIGFIPTNLARIERAPSYASSGYGNAQAVVIDYHALAKAPMPNPMPMAKVALKSSGAQAAAMPASSEQPKAHFVTSVAPTMNDVQSPVLESADKVKETIAKKETEINMLRKESEWMKRELRERDEEIKALKASKVSSKPAPKKKTAEAVPTR